MFAAKIVFIFMVISFVLSDDGSVKIRVKRGKYYSNPPARFYKKPPPPHVIKGPYSYTPPPFMSQDNQPYRSKVSKRPKDDGLADEDINNLVRHLTKKDFDKIVEFAAEKDRYLDKYRDESSERYEYSRPYKRPERTAYRDDDTRFSLNAPFVKDDDERSYQVEYSDPSYVTAKQKLYPSPPTYPEHLDKNLNLNYANEAAPTQIIYSNPPESSYTNVAYVNQQDSQYISELGDLSNTKIVYVNQPPIPQATATKIVYVNSQQIPNSMPVLNLNTNLNEQYINPLANNAIHSNAQLDAGESMYSKFSFVTPPTNSVTQDYVFTNSSMMNEEPLPRPLNLREDQDYEISYSNNVPAVVKSNSYKVESFKDLPLMNYHDSKLHTVDSYKVPHYTVTSTNSQQIPQPYSYSKPVYTYAGPSKPIPIERAPSGYTGREQSDAHLKAVKIWTHHSTGSAYTLHDDGTLSVEKPRHKAGYGRR